MIDEFERLARRSMTKKVWVVTAQALEKVLGKRVADRLGRKYLRLGNYHWRIYHLGRQTPYKMHVDYVVNYFQGREGQLLDVGCGTGLILSKLSGETNLNCYGIDLSPLAIELAHYHSVSACEAIDLFKYQVKKSERFDFIYIGDVLEHLRNPLAGLIRVKKWLNPQGTILIAIPIQTKLRLTDRLVFNYESACELIGSQFEIIHYDKQAPCVKMYFTAVKNFSNFQEPEMFNEIKSGVQLLRPRHRTRRTSFTYESS